MMQSELFTGSRLVAGAAGVDRTVTCINIIDGPFGYQYLKRGMLVLCSAYSIAGSTERQMEMMRRVHEHGVAAMALKAIHFPDNRIPEELCALADELEFPLVSLSDTCPAYADFITYFSNSVYLRGIQAVISKDELLKLLLLEISQRGIEGLVKKMGTLLGRGAAVLFEDTCYLSPQGETATAFAKALSASDSIQRFVPSGTFPGTLRFPDALPSPGDNLGAKLKTGGNGHNYLWLFGGETPFDEDDAAVLSSAKLVGELEVVQLLNYRQQSARRRRIFIDNLLSGKLKSLHEMLLAAKGLSWRLPLELRVLLITCAGGTVGSQEMELALNRQLERERQSITVFPYQDDLVVLLPVAEKTASCEGLLEIMSACFEGEGFYFGLGRRVSLKDTHVSYAQAKYALQAGRAIAPERHMFRFEEMGMFRLYCAAALPEELRLFCQDYVLPIIQVDSYAKLDLLRTLQTFFDCKENYSRAGNMLYLHPNTIRYRIETIGRICHVDFNDPEDVLNMKIALKLLPLVQEMDGK